MKNSQSRLPKLCNCRIPGKDRINTGCTINESGYCNRPDCPFVQGYANRLAKEEECHERRNGVLCICIHN